MLRRLLLLGLAAFIAVLPTLSPATSYAQIRTASEICITRWNWVTPDGSTPFWQAPIPDRVLGSVLDLRTRAQRILKGGVSEGYVLVVYDTAGTCVQTKSSLIIWDGDINQTLVSVEKEALKLGLGIEDSITEDTLADTIFAFLSKYSDPAGITSWKPLRAGQDGELKLFLPFL